MLELGLQSRHTAQISFLTMPRVHHFHINHRRLWLTMGTLSWILGTAATAELPDENVFLPKPQLKGTEVESLLDPVWRVGPWIWDSETRDKQHVNLWRAFDIPRGAKVESAKIHISVDNGYRLILDGRELGSGSDWRSVTEYDVTQLLAPGRHVMAVKAFNDNREAGMLFGMVIELKGGQVIEIPSDTQWRVVPLGERGWETRSHALAAWPAAVVESEFLPRDSHWHYRAPTMVVKVPALRPLESEFWQRGWVKVMIFGTMVVGGLLYLRVLAKLALQSRANAMLDEERARIARDIHDELGARLTEMALQGEVALMELPGASQARSTLEALCEKARATSGAMDELVWVVNSRRDTLRDFANFSCRHAQRFLESTPIRCRLDVPEDLPVLALDLPVRRGLLLAVKEALNNAAKHSHASELKLRIHPVGQHLRVRVEDDGVGFDLDASDPSRNGLRNMRDRMREIGGKCHIQSTPGGGCTIEFQVPLRPSLRNGKPRSARPLKTTQP